MDVGIYNINLAKAKFRGKQLVNRKKSESSEKNNKKEIETSVCKYWNLDGKESINT